MPTDGGGNWNRAARKSGGQRGSLFTGSPSVSWEEWCLTVRLLIRNKTGMLFPEKIVPLEKWREWYDAGERASWVASEILKFA